MKNPVEDESAFEVRTKLLEILNGKRQWHRTMDEEIIELQFSSILAQTF